MTKINWMIQEPVQSKKFGFWSSHIKNPHTSEIVFECMDFTKQWCLNSCIKWAIDKNKEIEETHAEQGTMGSTVDISGGHNSTTV